MTEKERLEQIKEGWRRGEETPDSEMAWLFVKMEIYLKKEGKWE